MQIRAIELIQTQGKVDKISIGDIVILNVCDLKLKFEFRKLFAKLKLLPVSDHQTSSFENILSSTS